MLPGHGEKCVAMPRYLAPCPVGTLVEITETFQSIYAEGKQQKIQAVEPMQRVGMKRNIFYRRVKEYEANL